MKIVNSYRNDDQTIHVAEDMGKSYWVIVHGLGQALLGPFSLDTAQNTAYDIMVRSIKTWDIDKLKLKQERR